MRQMHLRVHDVLPIVRAGDVIKEYRERRGALLYGNVGGVEVHVSLVTEGPVTLITTVYAVDRRVFPDGRTRRRQR